VTKSNSGKRFRCFVTCSVDIGLTDFEAEGSSVNTQDMIVFSFLVNGLLNIRKSPWKVLPLLRSFTA
jgi:hypothetical protein